MKKIFLSVNVIFMLLLCFSCKHENNDKNSQDSVKGELWAEQVESSASLTKPEGWSDEDWKTVAKGIDQEKIFNTVVESVLNGKQQAFDYITDSPISSDKVKSILTTTDTSLIDHGDGTIEQKATTTTINAKDISTVKFREKWYFDKEKFMLQSQITSIALFTNAYSEAGEIRGIKALFYVKLNSN